MKAEVFERNRNVVVGAEESSICLSVFLHSHVVTEVKSLVGMLQTTLSALCNRKKHNNLQHHVLQSLSSNRSWEKEIAQHLEILQGTEKLCVVA